MAVLASSTSSPTGHSSLSATPIVSLWRTRFPFDILFAARADLVNSLLQIAPCCLRITRIPQLVVPSRNRDSLLVLPVNLK